MPQIPLNIKACLFDMDGVLTETAKVHAAAWKEMFDTYLVERAKRTGEELAKSAYWPPLRAWRVLRPLRRSMDRGR